MRSLDDIDKMGAGKDVRLDVWIGDDTAITHIV